MAYTTTQQVTAAVNNFLDQNLLSRAYPLFVHTRWAQVRPIPRNGTAVIKFRKYGNLTAATTALTEGITPTGSQLSITDITATVAQYGDFITTTDFLEMTTLDPLKMEMSGILGDQMGDTMDQLTRDVMAAGTTVQYVQSVVGRASVAAGMVITGTEVKKAVRTLKGNNAKKITAQVDPTDAFNSAPIRAAFIGIASQNTEYDLKNDPDWVPVEEYAASTTVMDGELGKIDEVRFIGATTNAKVFSGGGAGGVDVHATLIFGKEFYGITQITGEAVQTITKPIGSAGTADPLDQRSTMGWKITFVAARLQEAFGLRLEHAVSS